MNVRRDYLFFSALAAVWATCVSLVGIWLDLGDDAVFVICMAMLPVLLIAWGKRDDARPHQTGSSGSRRPVV